MVEESKNLLMSCSGFNVAVKIENKSELEEI